MSRMTRAQCVLAITTLFTALYLLAFFRFFTIQFLDDKIAQQILPVVPWWLLVSFGSYSLWSLGLGLYNFRDCPEAYTELLGEINEAKNDLRAKGVTVD